MTDQNRSKCELCGDSGEVEGEYGPKGCVCLNYCGGTAQNLYGDCPGCPDCERAVKVTSHKHEPQLVVKEEFWNPPVAGTRTKVFTTARCGCGAIFARDNWYVPEQEGQER